MFTLIGEQNVMRVTRELDAICSVGKQAYPVITKAYAASNAKTPFMLRASMSYIDVNSEVPVVIDDRMLCRLITIYSYLEQVNIPTSFVLLDTVTLAMLNRIVS